MSRKKEFVIFVIVVLVIFAIMEMSEPKKMPVSSGCYPSRPHHDIETGHCVSDAVYKLILEKRD